MGKVQRAVCHLNIVGYRAAVAAVRDRGLTGRPFVITGTTGGRSLVLDLSPEAMKEGICPGMALAAAERKVKDLTVLPPDPEACETMNRELERIAAVYAPAYESDKQGNMYLDLTGTAGLFGPPADCSSRILREMLERTGMRPAAAVAGNKLVCKVASRAIRPVGLIQIPIGAEEAFLAHQDIGLLPGMGPGLLRTAAVTGFREIGELARLNDGEALALFGKRGPLLRDTARGIDTSPVMSGDYTEKKIEERLDFPEDIIDFETIRGGLFYVAEHTGLEMRKAKLGAGRIQVTTLYADGVRVVGEQQGKRPFVTDKEIGVGTVQVYGKIVKRRLRIRSISVTLGDLRPLSWEPDLFLPEDTDRRRRLQEAVDDMRNRYGITAITTGAVLAASGQKSVLPMLSYN
jgi:DNA polymerase-4